MCVGQKMVKQEARLKKMTWDTDCDLGGLLTFEKFCLQSTASFPLCLSVAGKLSTHILLKRWSFLDDLFAFGSYSSCQCLKQQWW